jgi:hypothetical protein
MSSTEVVPGLVEVEVAVPRSRPAVWWVLGVRQDTPTPRGEVVPVFVEFEVAVPHLRPAGW